MKIVNRTCWTCKKSYKPTGNCQRRCVPCKVEWRREGGRERVRKYQLTPKGKRQAKLAQQRRSERTKKEPWRRISQMMRWAIWKEIKNGRNNINWEQWVGYTRKDLMAHIERQFEKDMSWDNYGKYWQIDHIRPIVSFCINSPQDSDFKKCWALKNLRPLESKENARKGARY